MYDNDNCNTNITTVTTMEIDAIFLANSTEVQRGLLYVLGGGWTRTWALPGVEYPFEKSLSTSVLIRVGWNETNQDHTFELSTRDDDEQPIAELVKGGFKVGKPVDLTQGASQLVALSGEQTVKLPKPGIYHVVISIDGTEMKRIDFEALEKRPTGT